MANIVRRPYQQVPSLRTPVRPARPIGPAGPRGGGAGAGSRGGAQTYVDPSGGDIERARVVRQQQAMEADARARRETQEQQRQEAGARAEQQRQEAAASTERQRQESMTIAERKRQEGRQHSIFSELIGGGGGGNHAGGFQSFAATPAPAAPSFSFDGLRSAAMPMSGGGSIQPIGSIAPIDTRAADDARFARARDQAGMTGRASLNSLRGLLGETGQLGGGAEAAATRDIVQRAAGQMGEVGRSQAIQGSERNFQTALANQQAALTRRGQDIGAQEAQARLALAQTQLQSQRSLEMLRMALSQTAATMGSLY